jgi:hypothetical protein
MESSTDMEKSMNDQTISDLVDAAVAALNALVVRTIAGPPSNTTIPEWMQQQILEADLIVNHIQDHFLWVRDPDDECYWHPPTLGKA